MRKPWLLIPFLFSSLAAAAFAADGPGRTLLAADYSTKRVALIAPDGAIRWQHAVSDIHDLQGLPNGNILFQTSFTHLVEVDPQTDRTVWDYDAARMNGNEG